MAGTPLESCARANLAGVFHLVAALLLSLAAVAVQAAEALGPGDRAPGFSLRGSDGRTYTLSEFVGKRGVVLAWFPREFTPG